MGEASFGGFASGATHICKSPTNSVEAKTFREHCAKRKQTLNDLYSVVCSTYTVCVGVCERQIARPIETETETEIRRVTLQQTRSQAHSLLYIMDCKTDRYIHRNP